jgi:hypothetical protein
MPYANVERRRQFQREYKRKMRIALGKNSPLKEFRIYLCQRYPNMHIPGGGCFYQGFLITDDPAVQSRVQRHELFGTAIFPLALDLTVTPVR